MTSAQVADAVAYNRRRRPILQRRILERFGVASIDDALCRGIADWQEDHIAPGAGDGQVGARTEAHLGMPTHHALRAAEQAERFNRETGILFDSWTNDLRDNDGDGLVDEDGEGHPHADGMHYGRRFSSFRVIRNRYSHSGWTNNPTAFTVEVPLSVYVFPPGGVRYMVCADMISLCYERAGIFGQHCRNTEAILGHFRQLGYVWRRDRDTFPERYKPGDFICNWWRGVGGHSAIAVADEPARLPDGTIATPTIIDLPGPSSLVHDAGRDARGLSRHDPTHANDVRRHPWPPRRMNSPHDGQYLCRLLWSRLPH